MQNNHNKKLILGIDPAEKHSAFVSILFFNNQIGEIKKHKNLDDFKNYHKELELVNNEDIWIFAFIEGQFKDKNTVMTSINKTKDAKEVVIDNFNTVFKGVSKIIEVEPIMWKIICSKELYKNKDNVIYTKLKKHYGKAMDFSVVKWWKEQTEIYLDKNLTTYSSDDVDALNICLFGDFILKYKNYTHSKYWKIEYSNWVIYKTELNNYDRKSL